MNLGLELVNILERMFRNRLCLFLRFPVNSYPCQVVTCQLVPKSTRTHYQLVPMPRRTQYQVVPKSSRTHNYLVYPTNNLKDFWINFGTYYTHNYVTYQLSVLCILRERLSVKLFFCDRQRILSKTVSRHHTNGN